MNKVITKSILLSLIFILTACAYEPIFSSKDYGFVLGKIRVSGDKDINRNIENKLLFINKNDNNSKIKYNLSIDTEKEKRIISKNTKGDPLKFELFIKTNFQVFKDKEQILNRKIEKSYIYNNDTDKYKLEEDEKIISENLSEKISEVIISLIINLNDN